MTRTQKLQNVAQASVEKNNPSTVTVWFCVTLNIPYMYFQFQCSCASL